MEALKMIPYIILTICIAGVIAGASALTVSKFRDTVTDSKSNVTLLNATEAISTVAEQLPTVAIIGVLVIIISLLAGIFVYTRFFG